MSELLARVASFLPTQEVGRLMRSSSSAQEAVRCSPAWSKLVRLPPAGYPATHPGVLLADRLELRALEALPPHLPDMVLAMPHLSSLRVSLAGLMPPERMPLVLATIHALSSSLGGGGELTALCLPGLLLRISDQCLFSESLRRLGSLRELSLTLLCNTVPGAHSPAPPACCLCESLASSIGHLSVLLTLDLDLVGASRAGLQQLCESVAKRESLACLRLSLRQPQESELHAGTSWLKPLESCREKLRTLALHDLGGLLRRDEDHALLGTLLGSLGTLQELFICLCLTPGPTQGSLLLFLGRALAPLGGGGPRLTSLELVVDRCAVDDSALLDLGGALRAQTDTLEHLEISLRGLESPTQLGYAELGRAVGRLGKLKVLRFSITDSSGMRSRETAALTRGLIQEGLAAALCTLSTILLNFSGCKSCTLSRDWAQVLQSLGAARVFRLTATGSGLRDEDLSHLAGAAKLLCDRGLRTFHLKVDDNMLRGEGLCEVLRSLHSAPSLQDLHLSCAQNDLDDDGDSRLKNLIDGPGLEGLKCRVVKGVRW